MQAKHVFSYSSGTAKNRICALLVLSVLVRSRAALYTSTIPNSTTRFRIIPQLKCALKPQVKVIIFIRYCGIKCSWSTLET